jgi:hypothetical protein
MAAARGGALPVLQLVLNHHGINDGNGAINARDQYGGESDNDVFSATAASIRPTEDDSLCSIARLHGVPRLVLERGARVHGSPRQVAMVL